MAAQAVSHVDCEYHNDTDEWFIHVQGLRETDFKFKLGVPTQPRITDDGRSVTVMNHKFYYYC